MRKLTIFIVFFIGIIQLNAQEEIEFTKKGFIIVSSSKDYNATIDLAVTVSEKLNYNLDLRGLEYNSSLGLSFAMQVCEDNGFEYPLYVSRGRFDDGNYVSVEYTDAYQGFTLGYYIIIVSSYEKGNEELTKSLNFVKTIYKSAYIKYSDIFMGCMH